MYLGAKVLVEWKFIIKPAARSSRSRVSHILLKKAGAEIRDDDDCVGVLVVTDLPLQGLRYVLIGSFKLFFLERWTVTEELIGVHACQWI